MIGDASKKKKDIVFNASTESKEELDNEDMALLLRKINKFFQKNSNIRKGEGNNKRLEINVF